MNIRTNIFGGSYKEALLYLIQCITPLHVGTGQSYEGFVDLPIQRDNLGFPVIWGSSLKGAIRNTFHFHTNSNKDDENRIFGPHSDSIGKEQYSSAILITDASLLFMPVRSLYGLFAFCTHYYLLKRFVEMLSICNNSRVGELKNYIDTYKDECICSDDYILKDGKAILREEEIEIKVDTKLKNLFDNLLPNSFGLKQDILRRLVILNDKNADIIKRSTLIQTRIHLDYEKKTVKKGALWTEEFIPEMSILATTLLIRDEMSNRQDKLKAEDIKKKLKNVLARSNTDDLNEFYLIIGGNETLGRGITRFYKIG